MPVPPYFVPLYGVSQVASMLSEELPMKFGLMSRLAPSGDSPTQARMVPLYQALSELGATAEPVLYTEELETEIHEQLMLLDGVLVWVNPIDYGRDRSRLDALLRDVASKGIWVSTHPDVVLKLGTKEFLFDTRSMEWGTEVEAYRIPDELMARFPQFLMTSIPGRVLKQYRGTGGEGVWKVELVEHRKPQPGDQAGASLDVVVRVQEARRGASAVETTLGEFLGSCTPYFADGGHLIDQPFQERLGEGLIRCYLSHSEVIGFAHQGIEGLAPLPAERLPTTSPAYQALRRKLEDGWIAELKQLLALEDSEMPVLWDADFLLGPTDASGDDTYVLCEINVSCVSPIPEFAAGVIAKNAIESVRNRSSLGR